MNKKTQGFTLIELLTVIAILAIILLIAAPTILGVLDKARKNTFKNQALLYVSGLKTQMALSATGDSDIESKLNWTTEGNKRITTISISDLNNLIMDTEGLTSGSIKIEEDTTTNKYTYTLMDVANLDYKIPGSVIAEELDVEDIYKADEKVDTEKATINLSGIPSTVRHGESYAVPTSYTGDSIECKVGDTVVTNTSTLDAGTYTINCTSGSVTESKEITVQYEVNFQITGLGETNVGPTIDGNNLIFATGAGGAKIYLDKAGYSFDWVYSGASGTYSFISDSGVTTTFATGSGNYNGSYTNTESGYISLGGSGVNTQVKNLTYNGNNVVINDIAPSIIPNPVYSANCTINGSSWSCESEITENNSTVSGTVYIRVNNNNAYAAYTQVKINEEGWSSMTAHSNMYKKLTEPGTYRIKLRYNLAGNLGTYYSQETDEFVITIE